MSHARTQIRAAVVALLGGTGYPIVPGRVYPEGGPLPALAVTLDSERVMAHSEGMMGSTDQYRRLSMVVEARVAATAGLDDALDAVCLDVERALAADVELGGLVKWTELSATEYDRTDEGAQPIGLAGMIYTVDYRVDSSDPEIIRS